MQKRPKIYFLPRTLDYLSWFLFWFQSLGKSKEYPFLIDGVKFFLRKNTSDFFVVDEVFKKGVYGRNASGIVFDIGANIGAYTLHAAKTAESVFSFEPDTGNYKYFQNNLLLNNFKNVKVFKKAIGDKKRNAVLFRGHVNKGMSSTTVTTSKDMEEVEMLSLEDAMALCNVDHINTLKIDIEGGEYLLLENIPRYLFQKIDYIVMEFHHVPHKSFYELVRILKEAGYHVKIERRFLEKFFGTGIIKAVRV